MSVAYHQQGLTQAYVSYHHHSGDIIFGIIIGLIAGSLAYHSSYASLFDFRHNHIPFMPGPARMRF
jgi:hypothetical protein